MHLSRKARSKGTFTTDCYGLSAEAAIRAITLSPAEIFGVADSIGSLEVGKQASLIVATGDILDHRTGVTQVFTASTARRSRSRRDTRDSTSSSRTGSRGGLPDSATPGLSSQDPRHDGADSSKAATLRDEREAKPLPRGQLSSLFLVEGYHAAPGEPHRTSGHQMNVARRPAQLRLLELQPHPAQRSRQLLAGPRGEVLVPQRQGPLRLEPAAVMSRHLLKVSDGSSLLRRHSPSRQVLHLVL